MEEKESLQSLIAEIQELLIEVKNEQTKMTKDMERHHKVTMRKLSKLREFDEIADMANTVFEMRLSNIEQALKKAVIK